MSVNALDVLRAESAALRASLASVTAEMKAEREFTESVFRAFGLDAAASNADLFRKFEAEGAARKRAEELCRAARDEIDLGSAGHREPTPNGLTGCNCTRCEIDAALEAKP